jgi:heme exporter protein A
MLAVRDLACRRGDRLIFSDLTFTLEPGDALAVTGPNGAGKSSLLRVLAGLIPPFAGTIDYRPAQEASEGAWAGIGYVGHLDAAKADLTALETLAFWARLADRRQAEARARRALDAYGVAHLADLPMRFASAGQKRRVALARLLAAPARLWLLDEPSVALDSDGQTRLAEVIARHRAAGGLIVSATHQDLALPGAQSLTLAPAAAPVDVLAP